MIDCDGDVQIDRQWSAAALLSRCRGLIFQAVKTPVLVSALTYTAYGDAGQFDLKLNRPRVSEGFIDEYFRRVEKSRSVSYNAIGNYLGVDAALLAGIWLPVCGALADASRA